MRILITDQSGQSVDKAVSTRLHAILSKLRNSGKLVQDGLLWTVKEHFVTIYPGSSHYSPDKVTRKTVTNGKAPAGSIDIDVPGITRAYRSLTIRPRFKKALTIPMHREAYGRKPADFTEAFVVKTKNDNLAIAKSTVNGLAFLFSLVKKVFQKKDSRIMPSDRTLANNVFSRIKAHLDDNSAPTGIGGRWY